VPCCILYFHTAIPICIASIEQLPSLGDEAVSCSNPFTRCRSETIACRCGAAKLGKER